MGYRPFGANFQKNPRKYGNRYRFRIRSDQYRQGLVTVDVKGNTFTAKVRGRTSGRLDNGRHP